MFCCSLYKWKITLSNFVSSSFSWGHVGFAYHFWTWLEEQWSFWRILNGRSFFSLLISQRLTDLERTTLLCFVCFTLADQLGSWKVRYLRQILSLGKLFQKRPANIYLCQIWHQWQTREKIPLKSSSIRFGEHGWGVTYRNTSNLKQLYLCLWKQTLTACMLLVRNRALWAPIFFRQPLLDPGLWSLVWIFTGDEN